jgi:hypothetical protein
MQPILIALALVAVATNGLAADEISTCGQAIAERGEGTLVADLACPNAVAVTVGRKATLSMAGHSIVGTIMCESSCDILGPGDVASGSSATNAIYINPTPKRGIVTVSGITVHDSNSGIGDAVGRLVLTDFIATGNQSHGVFLTAGRLRGSNVTSNGNGGAGIFVANGSVRLDQLTAVGNSGIGLITSGKRAPMLSNSTLTDNVWTLGGGELVDLSSSARPKLSLVTCDHSDGPNGPWGVCAGD